MQETTNYGLKKPGTDDYYDVGDFNDNMDTIDAKMKELEDASGQSQELADHIADKTNPHQVTKAQVGLSNVPNVSTNNQTPTYAVPQTVSDLQSGETLATALGKISKAVSNLNGFRFGIDGDGNYGYYKADDSFIPFKRGVEIDPLYMAWGTATINNGDNSDGTLFTGTDSYSNGGSTGASSGQGTRNGNGFYAHYENSANYGAAPAYAQSANYNTLGYKYLKVYISSYSTSTRRSFAGVSVTAVDGDAPTLISGSVSAGQTLVYDISKTKSFYVYVSASGDNAYGDGRSNATASVNNIRLTNVL